ncbi:phage antirepressor [Kocuria tytonicola]|nr:phage antirepressor KilAC domain-containing protein [Kocuria tytonicola]
MSQELTHFIYGDHQVRVVEHEGMPWFVATDLARILEYRNASDLTRGIEDEDLRTHIVRTNAGPRGALVVSEGGLYTIFVRARTERARPFRRWVTHEVLPQIRKTGAYTAQPQLQVPQSLPEALRAYAREVEAREAMEAYAQELEPKGEAYDAFLSGDGTYSIGNVAKMHGLSQNKLFALMRSAGVMIAKGAMRNTPYQRYMHHFAVKAYDFTRTDGTVGTSYTTRVQPSGVDFLRRKLSLTPVTNVEVAA